MSASLHVFSAQLVAIAIALFVVISMCRYSVFDANVAVPTDNSDYSLFGVSVIFTPFLYVDTNARILHVNLPESHVTAAQNAAVFDSPIYPVWSKDMDFMPTCNEFGKVAVSAKCSIAARGRINSLDMTTCVNTTATSPYADDCVAIRAFWIAGATLLGLSFFTIMWPIWTGAGSNLARTIATSGALMLSSAICFIVYTPMYVTLLTDVNSVMHDHGITDIDNARHLLYTLTGVLFVAAFTTMGVSLMGVRANYSSYKAEILNPLFIIN